MCGVHRRLLVDPWGTGQPRSACEGSVEAFLESGEPPRFLVRRLHFRMPPTHWIHCSMSASRCLIQRELPPWFTSEPGHPTVANGSRVPPGRVFRSVDGALVWTTTKAIWYGRPAISPLCQRTLRTAGECDPNLWRTNSMRPLHVISGLSGDVAPLASH